MASVAGFANDPGDTDPQGAARYVEWYREDLVAVEPPDKRRMVALTAAFTPMVTVGALPITALVATIASIIANVTARWVGLIVLAVSMVTLGYAVARIAAHYQDVPRRHGWRRWVPLVSSVVVVAGCVTEIASGSKAPDPIMAVWFGGLAWLFGMMPYAAGKWGPGRKALWIVAPAVTAVAIMFVWTQGFFSFRFARAAPQFDAIAAQVAAGDHVQSGQHVDSFVVRRIDPGHVGGYEGCDLGIKITGWHTDDTRYIAHCTGHPKSDARHPDYKYSHLSGNWWEVKGKV